MGAYRVSVVMRAPAPLHRVAPIRPSQFRPPTLFFQRYVFKHPHLQALRGYSSRWFGSRQFGHFRPNVIAMRLSQCLPY